MAKSCFFISRIGRPGSPEREFSDRLLQWIIEPALQGLGYESPVRADHITEPGVITTQVFKRLWNDDLVIADLTGGNPNVFYELAVRHLVRKPCVHLIESGASIPFDVAPNRTVEFGFEIEPATSAQRLLRAMIENAEAFTESETPLSIAIGLAYSGGSAQSSRPDMSEILSAVKETRNLIESQSRRGVSFRIETNPQKAEPATDASPRPTKESIVEPFLIERTEPEYPPLAKAARVQGTIRLNLTIDADGVVKDSKLISGPPLLASAAASAVHTWKYRPATSEGVPVEFILPVDIRFTLPQ